jgi:hypothetical protein
MDATQAKELGLDNNAFHLATAIDMDGHCEPASRVVRDGHHKGTMFSWFENKWTALDLENREYLGQCEKLAVVTLCDCDCDDADRGLNQAAWGIDFEVEGGEWVIDAEELDDLREIYGEQLVLIWEQV